GLVEMAGGVVTRFGFLVAQTGGDVTIPGGQPGLSAAHVRALCGPGVLAILRRVVSIFSRDPAVVDCPFPAVGSLGTPRVGPGAFVGRAVAIARRAVPGGPVAITGRVVTRLGLAVTQPGGDVTVPRRQPGVA